MSNVLPLDIKEVSAGLNVDVTARDIQVTDKLAVPTVEEMNKRLDDVGAELRRIVILTKRLPRTMSFDPHQDPTRSIAVGQQYLQTGMMWMRRAVNPWKEF